MAVCIAQAPSTPGFYRQQDLVKIEWAVVNLRMVGQDISFGIGRELQVGKDGLQVDTLVGGYGWDGGPQCQDAQDED